MPAAAPQAPMPPDQNPALHRANAALVLADGSVFFGHGFGASGAAVGEVCFNTGMSGYQEVLTDPSYAAQIINFTFPHIGNVGANAEDLESLKPAARGLIVRAAPTKPANWRSQETLDSWLVRHQLIGIYGLDTRALTRHIRKHGAPNGVIAHAAAGNLDIPALQAMAKDWPGLKGMDLAKEVSCHEAYEWGETRWQLGAGFGELTAPRFHVVAIDYGAKRNILRCLASAGCRVTVVPAQTQAEEILALKPDGVFLSNGPGDPAATGVYAVPTLQAILKAHIPIFGICLGHQLLALALGGRTEKMQQGHRGANHPVKELASGRVEITSQNHGFHVVAESVLDAALITHVSLFDGSNEGLQAISAPAFSVQYHPEASPGPHDSHPLFNRFVALMERQHAKKN